MASASSASSPAVRRLRRDLEQLGRCPNPQIAVRPSLSSLLEWHFVLHGLPEDTPYAGAYYHGMLKFPDQYPLAPPSLFMITPNGRLKTNERLCLSMTDFHPESWNPAWTVESLLVGVISFMLDDQAPPSVGAISETPGVRRRLAEASVGFNKLDSTFCELFPEFVEPDGDEDAPRTGEAKTERQEDSSKAGLSLSVPGGLALEEFGEEEVPAEACPVVPAAPQVDTASRAEDRHGVIPEEVAVPKMPSPPFASATRAASTRVASFEDETSSFEREWDAVVAQSSENSSRPSSAQRSQPGRAECWICREDDSEEPLVQPCACRGSMSGVHASCVEGWIAHHRANSVSDQLPSCSVCGQAYSGTERRPGVVLFARHLCTDFTRQACRSFLLVALLVAYWTAAQPDIVVYLPVRVMLFVLSGSFFLYKSCLLMVSLPCGGTPPDNCLRFLFIADLRNISIHIAETFAIIVIAALWCLYGQLHYVYVLPLTSLIVMPLIAVLAKRRESPCSQRSLLIMVMILCSPAFFVVHLARMVWSAPHRIADPFDGLIHAVVPVASIPLCLFCRSNAPVVILWGAHSCTVLLGILERTAVKRAKWQEGRAWWIFMQLSILAAYVGNLLHRFTDGFVAEHSSWLIGGMSLLWLSLSCTLTMMVNWNICIQQYRTWQRRHGRFSLSPAGTPRGENGAPAHMIGAADGDP